MKLEGPNYITNKGEISSLCIFLHGWGSDGNDLIQLAPELAKKFDKMLFLSPNAPDVCSANPMGRQWFEINSLPINVDHPSDLLEKYIDENLLKYNLSSKQLFLFGFSQGAMMALHVGLRYKNELAGIMAYSGMLLFPEQLNEIKNSSPILLVHGKDDEVVPHHHLENSSRKLLDYGINLENLSINNLGHGINLEGINKAKEFISKNLN